MKQQVPWRLDTADTNLHSPMFDLAYVEGMHIIAWGKSTEKWDKFVDLLFEQDAFKNFERTSTQSIKTQFNNRIAAFKRKHGWEDGRTGNLSDERGDLTKPDSTIKTMLVEIETEREKAKTLAADKEAVEKSEVTILQEAFADRAKSKRKNKTFLSPGEEGSESDRSTPCSTNSSFEYGKLSASIQALSAYSQAVNNPTVQLHAPEQVVEKKMLDAIGHFTATKFVEAMGANDVLGTMTELVEEATVAAIINVYCSPHKKFDASVVKAELKELGFSPMFTMKMYKYLASVRDEVTSSPPRVIAAHHLEQTAQHYFLSRHPRPIIETDPVGEPQMRLQPI